MTLQQRKFHAECKSIFKYAYAINRRYVPYILDLRGLSSKSVSFRRDVFMWRKQYKRIGMVVARGTTRLSWVRDAETNRM